MHNFDTMSRTTAQASMCGSPIIIDDGSTHALSQSQIIRDIIDTFCFNFRLPDYVWFDALSSSPLFEEDRWGMNCHDKQTKSYMT